MKNATEHAATLRQLLHKLADQVPRHDPPRRSPLEQMVHAFLTWQCTHHQADPAFARLMRHVVDLNDLRVSDPGEIVAVIGRSYERAHERAARLKASLNAIYRREHAMDLSPLHDKPKRDVRAYLESLDGMVPYIAANVALFSFGAHAVPVDEQLHKRLLKDGVIDPAASLAETQTFLEHHIHLEDAIDAYYRLRAYVERPIKVQLRSAGARRRAPSRKPVRKTTTRKKASSARR